MNDADKKVRAVEAIYHEVGLVAAEDGRSTKETRAAATRLSNFARARVAEVRRAAAAKVPRAVVDRRPVRPSLLAMARDTLLARVEAIRAAHPGALSLGALHHKLAASVSDDDLRSLVEDAERAIEDSEKPASES